MLEEKKRKGKNSKITFSFLASETQRIVVPLSWVGNAGWICWVELLGHTVILCLVFWGTAKLFHSGYTILHFHHQCTRFPISPYSCQYLLLSDSDYSHPGGCEVKSYCSFDLHFLNEYDAEHFFLCLLTICVFHFGGMAVKSLPIFNWVNWVTQLIILYIFLINI